MRKGFKKFAAVVMCLPVTLMPVSDVWGLVESNDLHEEMITRELLDMSSGEETDSDELIEEIREDGIGKAQEEINVPEAGDIIESVDMISEGEGETEGSENPENTAIYTPDGSAAYGNPRRNSDGSVTYDCVWFGNYWQDDTDGNGTANTNDSKTPVKWRVLSATNDDLFLLADRILDAKAYNTSSSSITWEKSTIRSWLNGYGASYNNYGADYTSDNFIDKAFTSAEKNAIKNTFVDNSISQGRYDTNGGNDTYDKLFFLSFRESITEGYGFSTSYSDYDKARRAKTTAFAKARGAFTSTSSEYEGNGLWWLRSPGNNSEGAALVGSAGYTGYFDNMSGTYNGARPALHISPSSSLISPAGTVCSDGTVDEKAPTGGGTGGGNGGESESSTVQMWKELLGTTSINNYKNDLAIKTCFLSDEAEDTSDLRIRNAYASEKYGLTDIVTGSSGGVGDYSGDYAYAIGRIDLGEDNLIVITARGSTNVSEYLRDYTTGVTKNRFFGYSTVDIAYDFEEIIWSALNMYLDNHPDIESSGKGIKIVVCGHSLGGAAANLVAARLDILLDRGEFLSDIMKKSDVYAYTFGAIDSVSPYYYEVEELPMHLGSPRVIRKDCNYTVPIEESFDNIHNVFNLMDSFAPNSLNVRVFDSLGNAMGISGGKAFTMYGKFGHLHTFSKDYGDMSIGDSKNHTSYKEAIDSSLVNGCDFNAPGVTDLAHWAVGCPVDVEVLKDSTVVCQIENDTIVMSNPDIPVYVYGDIKHLFIPRDNYNVNIYSRDEGTMTCIIEGNGEIKHFDYIELSEGKTFVSDVNIENNPSDIRLLVIGDSGETIKEVLEDGQEVDYNQYGDVLSEDIPEDGIIPSGIWIAGVGDKGYTGKANLQSFRVYNKTTLLTENTDYTIAYKNNTNAYTLSEDDPGFNAGKAPTVIITGNGNYSSKETVYFKILPQDISGDDFDSDNIVLAYTGKNQKVKPALCWNGRALKSGTDYTAQIFRASDTGFSSPLGESVKEAGDYVICLTGRGNFAQKRYVDLKVTDVHKPVSRLSYSKVPDVSYTGDEIRPEPVVRDGKTVLAKDEHYTLSYESNTDVGTGYVIVTGMQQGGYAGVRRIAFKITGTPLKKATVSGIAKSYIYSGNEITLKDEDLKLYIKSTKKTPQTDLTRDTDYTVSYTNNIKSGTASIILEGKGGYTGSVKKTFNINKYSIANDTEGRFIVDCAETADYAKGGARPSVTISYRNADGSISALKEGTDYKLTFKNNTSLTGRGLPTVTITGMGNYEGTRNVTFTISEKDISAVSMEAADKVYKNKAGSYATSVVLKDTDGKNLKAGKDYDKKIRYEYASDAAVIVSGEEEMRASGEEVGENDIIPAGTMIRAIVTAEPGSGYTGTISGTYRIVRAGIGSMKAVIPAQEYTGREITLDPANITVKAGKTVLKPYDEVTGEGDYVITGYSDNIRKGKAKVTFRGVGNYGGTRTVTFNIRAKGIKWWWR